MNEIQKLIHKTVVTPALKERLHGARGYVVSRDHHHSTATVEFTSIHGEGKTVLDNVPIQIGSSGFHSAGPFPGDEVWISFMGGNILHPQITSIIDCQYYLKTREYRLRHNGKGTHLPDSFCGR